MKENISKVTSAACSGVFNRPYCDGKRQRRLSEAVAGFVCLRILWKVLYLCPAIHYESLLCLKGFYNIACLKGDRRYCNGFSGGLFHQLASFIISKYGGVVFGFSLSVAKVRARGRFEARFVSEKSRSLFWRSAALAEVNGSRA